MQAGVLDARLRVLRQLQRLLLDDVASGMDNGDAAAMADAFSSDDIEIVEGGPERRPLSAETFRAVAEFFDLLSDLDRARLIALYDAETGERRER
jgi:hypothetical protein